MSDIEDILTIVDNNYISGYPEMPCAYWFSDSDFRFVDDIFVAKGRWQEFRMCVVERNGKFYGIEYSNGLTEMQENEFYADKTQVYEIEPYEYMVKSYRKI